MSTNSNFKTRAYNTFDVSEDTITKHSTTDRLADEISYYQNLPENAKNYFAKFISAGQSFGEYSLCLEKYPYANLGTKLTQPFDQSFWQNALTEVKSFLDLAEKTTPASIKQNSVQEASDGMIDYKTIKYYDYLDSFRLKAILEPEAIVVNGEPLANFWWLKKKFQQKAKEFLEFEPTLIHGDFCFSNILVSPDGSIIKLVDPRGSYGFRGVWGDRAYDIAKLYHSCHGMYDLIINDQFDLKVSLDYKTEVADLNIDYSFEPNCSAEVNALMESIIPRTEKDRFIEGAIFIGMCSRHYDSKERQIVMYCTGLKILNDLLK